MQAVALVSGQGGQFQSVVPLTIEESAIALYLPSSLVCGPQVHLKLTRLFPSSLPPLLGGGGFAVGTKE